MRLFTDFDTVELLATGKYLDSTRCLAELFIHKQQRFDHNNGDITINDAMFYGVAVECC
jgi:hypothetical protein